VYVAKEKPGYGGHKNVISLPVAATKAIRMPKTDEKAKDKFKRILATGEPGTCQWIEGEASERNFCGEKVSSGAWCSEHRRRVYTPCKPSQNQGSLTLPLRVKPRPYLH
jgi:hypothetical protein